MTAQKFPIPSIQPFYPDPLIFETFEVHVNSSTGNDTTGDGSLGLPWQTLQRAIDSFANIRSREYKILATGTFTDVTLDLGNLRPVRTFSSEDSDGNPGGDIMAAELSIEETTQSFASLFFDFTRANGSVGQGVDTQATTPNPFIINSSEDLGVKFSYGYFRIFGDSIMLKNQVASFSDCEFAEETGSVSDAFFYVTDCRLGFSFCNFFRNAGSDIEDVYEGNFNYIEIEETDLDIYGLADGGKSNIVNIGEFVNTTSTSAWDSGTRNELFYVGFDERNEDVFDTRTRLTKSYEHQNNFFYHQSFPASGIPNNEDVYGTINTGFAYPPPFTPLRQVIQEFSILIQPNTIFTSRFPEFTRMAEVNYHMYVLDSTVAQLFISLLHEVTFYEDSKFSYTGGPGTIITNAGAFNTNGAPSVSFFGSGSETLHNFGGGPGNDGTNQLYFIKYSSGTGLCGYQLDSFYNVPIVLQIRNVCSVDDS